MMGRRAHLPAQILMGNLHHGSMGRIMQYLCQYVYGSGPCAVTGDAAQRHECLLLHSDLSTSADTHCGQVISSTSSSFGSVLIQYYHAHRRMLHHCHHHDQCHAHTVSIWLHRSLCTTASKEADDKAGSSDGNSAHEEEAWKTLALAMQMQSLHGQCAKGEALKALKDLVDHLEPFANPADLRFGAACLLLAQSFLLAKEYTEESLCYAQKALRSYESLNGSVEHAQCLETVGSAYCNMNQVETAVAYLEQCASVLRKIKGPMRNDVCNKLEVSVHQTLGRAKACFLGNFCGSLTHFAHLIRIGEKSFKPGNPQLASWYAEAGLVSGKVKDLDGALHLSLKAFNAYMTCYGPSSLQVAQQRATLVGIYSDLGKYDDALSEFEEARPVLEYLGDMELVAFLNLRLALLLKDQERYDAAMPRLEEVIERTQVSSSLHVTALLGATDISHKLNKKEVAADYWTRVLVALEHQEASVETAINLVWLCDMYKDYFTIEQAAELLQKVLKMFEKCGYPSRYSYLKGWLEARVGQLLLETGKAKEAIPYLESCLSKKESLQASELVDAHMCLGIAYSYDTQMHSEALKQFEACDSLLNELWKTRLTVAICKNHAIMHHIFGIMGAFEHMCICILWLVTRTA